MVEGDERAQRARLLDELRSVVPFEAHAWLLTDPETEVGSSPLAEVPDLAVLPRLIRLKYLTAVNRWTAMEGSVATLTEPDRSLVWRELLSGLGVTDVASLVFRDRHGCWGFLDLWRATGAFTDAELDHLRARVGPITERLRRAQAETFLSTTTPPLPAPDRAGPAVLVLGPDLSVRAQTPQSEADLRVLVPTDEGRRPIPAAAYNVAAQLLAVEAGIDDHPATARVHLAGGRWVTFRAARLGDGIAVTIEASSPLERLEVFVRAFALTSREAELLGHLVAGADSRDVAARMFVSEHTVQDHLKAVFAKTGLRSRRALLAHVSGN